MQRAITVSEEYSKLVPELSAEEYQRIRESIAEQGQWFPIIVNESDVVLDGHNRLKVCEELGIEPKVEVKTFSSKNEEKIFVVESNLKRRQLDTLDRLRLGDVLKPLYEERAKERHRQGSSEGGKATAPVQSPKKGKRKKKAQTANEDVAKKTGVSERTRFMYEYVMHSQFAEIKQAMLNKKIKVTKAYKKVLKEEKRLRIMIQQPKVKLSNAVKIYNQDFRAALVSMPKESVDLIFTDPPYADEFLPLYKDLAALAAHVLKPGGSLVTYLNQQRIPEVLQYMKNVDLNYWWILAVKHNGGSASMWGKKVFVGWKPLLWFVKGDKLLTDEYMADYIESQPPEKVMHEWEQSTVEAEHVIHQLTYENGIILDPFMGSGTTGAGALKLKRQFIGCEIDAEKFNVAKIRLGQYRSS